MPTGDIYNASTLRVQTRAAWAAADGQSWETGWATVPYLEPLNAIRALGPSLDSAEFLFHFGILKRYDQNTVAAEAALADLKGTFVRIQDVTAGTGPGEPVNLWYGQIVSETARLTHPVDDGAEEQPTGSLVLLAFGLAYVLDRTPIRQSSVLGGGGAPGLIDRTLRFNDRYFRGLTQFGNRSAETFASPINDDSVHVFSLRPGDGLPWDAHQILRYQLAVVNLSGVPFVLTGQTAMLAAHTPVRFAQEGLSILQVLNQLADRRAGMCWSTGDPDSNGVVPIRIHSVLDAAVDFYGDGSVVLPANDQQFTFDVDRFDVSNVEHLLDGQWRYDWLVVRGAPLRAAFTVAFGGGTLLPGWTSQQESDYVAAAAEERTTDEHNNVFRRFVLPDDFVWFNSDGEDITAHPIIPNLVDDGGQWTFLVGGVAHRTWGMSLLDELPIRESWEADGEPDPETEFRRPFVLLRKPAAEGQSESERKWFYVDKGEIVDMPERGVRMIGGGLGFMLEGGSLAHELGLNHTTVDDLGNERVDYTTMIATVAVESDFIPEIEVKLNAAATRGEGGLPAGAVLVIDVPDAELWYVTPGTVLDVDGDGTTLVRQADGPLATLLTRDDGDRLRRIAAMGKVWYGRARQAAQYTIVGIKTAHAPGVLLKLESGSWTRDQGGFTAVGSVVTTRHWDFRNFTTTYATDFHELDLPSL